MPEVTADVTLALISLWEETCPGCHVVLLNCELTSGQCWVETFSGSLLFGAQCVLQARAAELKYSRPFLGHFPELSPPQRQ